jgi:hypothetical protein
MNNQEKLFLRQSEPFLERLLTQRGYASLTDVEGITSRQTFPLVPVTVRDIARITAEEKSQLVDSYSQYGVSYFVCRNPNTHGDPVHPLFQIADQLKDQINLRFPYIELVDEVVDGVERMPDPAYGTAKVYDRRYVSGGSERDISETNLGFEAHSDGLGSGNTVENVILYCDSAPLFGGFTFFFDVLALSLQLAKEDYKAFQHLFIPSGLTAVRREGAIKVVGPVLYLDDDGNPNAFFRRGGGEYILRWYQGSDEFARGVRFLTEFTTPFCKGSYFVTFSRKGHGAISRNFGFVHSRTPFIDGDDADQKRVLSKKWFMKSVAHQEYKRVPGICLSKDYASLFPEYFGADSLRGEWRYDADTGNNQRL